MNDNISIESMFESIKESLSKEKQGSVAFKDILRTEPGNTYIVRLIPDIKDPKATFFHYYHHGWTSLATGQYVDAICPTTFGERCPICETRFKLYKTKKEEDRKVAYLIRRLEKHLVNVYVVSDPTTPENVGTIKILRFGKRLHEKIMEAIEGGDAEEFGAKVFDLTEKGCNFKIKVDSTVEGNRKYANYNNSRFTAPNAIDGMTPDKLNEVYTNIHQLTNYITSKPTKEMKEMLDTHLFTVDSKKESAVDEAAEPFGPANPEEDQLDMGPATPPPEPPASAAEETAEAPDEKSNSAKIKELLDDIDTL